MFLTFAFPVAVLMESRCLYYGFCVQTGAESDTAHASSYLDALPRGPYFVGQHGSESLGAFDLADLWRPRLVHKRRWLVYNK